jgi:short-subunit dehydrogenase
MKELRGKNAIVTGASRGLGVYIAKRLAEEGVNVALAARSADRLDDVCAECAAMGVRTISIAADVTSLDDQRRVVAMAEREFGTVDILVNNAGIEIVSAFKDLSLDQIDDVIRTNLSAPIWLTKLVLPSMLSRRSGAIVQVASLAGKTPVPYNSIYATTKAGLINFSESLQIELKGTGVTSSVVCPGFVSDAGMWADHEAGGGKLPMMLRTVGPEKVAAGVVKAIKGQPEVVVATGPMRPLLALSELSPRIRVGLGGRMGLTKAMRDESERLALGADRGKAASEAEAETVLTG